MRKISVFGATGSIGQSTLDLIARAADDYHVVALTGGANIDQLAKDAIRFRAEVAVTCHDHLLPDLRDRLAGTGIEATAGDHAIDEAATRYADWTMSAIVGAAGLRPGLTALRHGGTLALANKESLVTAGPLLKSEAAGHGARILPVDSEHSAVFQALVGEDIGAVEKVTITASGGALRDWPIEKLASATVEQASTHPTWAMGQRITIDSASMFNKAMELIEAHEFFGLPSTKIDAIIHRESLVHALVGFRDGAIMAHLGASDMRHAIGYALHWPERLDLPVGRLDLARIGSLTFSEADPVRYPALRLARDVMEAGPLAGTVFNAAKEVALDAFIARRIGFTDMARVVETTLNKMFAQDGLAMDDIRLEDIIETDRIARVSAWEAVE